MKKPNYVNNSNFNSINVSNHLNVRKFNPVVIGSLKPHGKLGKEVKNWEEDLIMNLNNVNSSEEDDHRTSYVKYKLFKRDIYGLALVDTGNLVKETFVSSEIWKFESGTHSDTRVKSCSCRSLTFSYKKI